MSWYDVHLLSLAATILALVVFHLYSKVQSMSQLSSQGKVSVLEFVTLSLRMPSVMLRSMCMFSALLIVPAGKLLLICSPCQRVLTEVALKASLLKPVANRLGLQDRTSLPFGSSAFR